MPAMLTNDFQALRKTDFGRRSRSGQEAAGLKKVLFAADAGILATVARPNRYALLPGGDGWLWLDGRAAGIVMTMWASGAARDHDAH
jgi:hypothetical protein